ncbi:Di-copper centre-containing protein [Aaosphaeria arxii CBS 175.79]|uniref:Di-copper centre-containing protein n=1 Tax=Aaosphaeria arxii CBS 175.79 TaxID=1450172 RepID=A0A6A5XIH6_9PLEO|nr:Di-copper centre-containing protein [Aaosphaeria arxii CBS 175.79]KAF2013058.1 Di-copper centre-containing protein [Aaosphaeria arxii CBS 175.79]
MLFSYSTVLLAGASMVSAATIPIPSDIPIPSGAPAINLEAFKTQPFKGWPVNEILTGGNRTADPKMKAEQGIMATCGNPRYRREWHSLDDNSKQNFVNSVKCLLSRPASGQFGQARNRYEDLVALHQQLKNNVHENRKFLLWHRYFLWTFEQLLRSECGFTADLPWFDETRYAGRFSQSDIFSSRWLGGIALGGRCVTDGQFANLALNIGPGTSNTRHCLARNGDAGQTANTNANVVNGCNARTNYAEMSECSEYSAHAYGHNGIGAVMQDVWASPSDPVFWLHHAFIDRNFRVWQNANMPARVSTINGNDAFGRPLTMGMSVSVNGIRPDTTIGNIMNTLDTTLCYRYDY